VLVEHGAGGDQGRPEQLRQLSNDFCVRMVELEAEAHRSPAGRSDLGSPKQIVELLFSRKMVLASGATTATGAMIPPTHLILEDLGGPGPRAPPGALELAPLSKLKVHLHRQPVGGRSRAQRPGCTLLLASRRHHRPLASSDPNLRTSRSAPRKRRKIRKAFIAEPATC
jgi:DNA polymerase-1